MQEERLSGALQENVLTILCFNDSACGLIRHTVSPQLFESSIFRDIASHAISFYDQFNKAIKEHLPDSLEHILKGSDVRKARAYEQVLDNLFHAKDSTSAEYVVSKLNAFVRQQRLKSGVVEAVERIQEGNVEAAEVALEKCLKDRGSNFEIGTVFTDTKKSLAFFDTQEHAFSTGIQQLDDRDIGPRRGELFLFIAPPKKGKSWFMVQLAKFGLLQRLRVLVVSLEMSEERYSQRFVQSFFSISKRQAELIVSHLKVDQLGRLIEIDEIELERPTLRDEGIRTFVDNNIKRRFTNRPPLVIKRFPTGSLSMTGLRAYLDSLERHFKFVPDLLIIDYPNLMAKNSNLDVREGLGQLLVDLRGLAVERNLALVCPTQGNRASSTAKLVTDAMVAEDWSMIMTADNVVTYSQTEAEKKQGLARLFVSNGRNDEDRFVVLITQSYPIGQFCLESTMMSGDYDKILDRANGDDEDKDE